MLWRAGFGPTPGQAEKLSGQPVEQVVRGLTRPVGSAKLVGGLNRLTTKAARSNPPARGDTTTAGGSIGCSDPISSSGSG
jgi:hypothetical protein